MSTLFNLTQTATSFADVNKQADDLLRRTRRFFPSGGLDHRQYSLCLPRKDGGGGSINAKNNLDYNVITLLPSKQ